VSRTIQLAKVFQIELGFSAEGTTPANLCTRREIAMTSFILSILFYFTAAYAQSQTEPFYSFAGSERKVSFVHAIETDYSSLSQIENLGAAGRREFVQFTARPLMKFLFGPLTNRRIGGPQHDDQISVQWNSARIEAGRVVVDIEYKATWMIENTLAERPEMEVPMPRNYRKLFTKSWKKCTDSSPEHATESFFWYFWDPERPGCDHAKGVHYDIVTVRIGEATVPTVKSYPEYARMVREENGERVLKMTYAFGYVEDPEDPHPEKDPDFGAQEYRSFLYMIGSRLSQLSARPIFLSEYDRAYRSDRVIGYRFQGAMNGVKIDMNVVIAAGIDQMYLFAESFAHRHDAVFAWMGHSRVGGGFDAASFSSIVATKPSYYSITDDYQLIYWGGCNSYSYYTLPFFDFKAKAFPEIDPNGTRGLDIIAHGLPSYFSLNSPNAEILLKAVLSPGGKTTYQEIIRELELNGREAGARLLATVLGDEDNSN
jgi:hypothetical protein